jgi:cytochrome c oxidase subunit 2
MCGLFPCCEKAGEIDVKKFWCLFFMIWPVLAIYFCWIAPANNWSFPSEPGTPLGVRIDNLFYLILLIVTIVFIGTQIGLGYALWGGAREPGEKALFTHGSHDLEVIWTIVPSGILLFIALYQMEVWAEYRIQANFPEQAMRQPIAEVTARQFEWRIRYPDPGRKFGSQAEVRRWLKQPEPDDLYTVNDLHVPAGKPVLIHLRSEDVQHSFFVPKLRVKQDAVPGLVIPIWFEIPKADRYELLCAELCGWGHYKMKAQVWAQPTEDYDAYLEQLRQEQFDDGVEDEPEPSDDRNN